MPATIDFAALPPEINSTRLHSGPGSAPLLAAASAWDRLAAELRTTALSYQRVLSALADDEWQGQASASMATATAAFVAWMWTAAHGAEQAALHAAEAVRAYETALAAMVSPDAIAANRAQRDLLITTNVLGQNIPAIAATEANYAEMWIQDALAMYTYASSSSSATRLTPFTEPQPIARPGGLATGSIAAAQITAETGSTDKSLSQLISAVPRHLQTLATPTISRTLDQMTDEELLPPWLKALWDNWGPDATIWGTVFSSPFMPGNWLGNFSDFLGLAVGQAASAVGDVATSPLDPVVTETVSATGAIGNPVTVGLAHASRVGPLSVPPSWTAVPQPSTSVAATLETTPTAAAPAMGAGVPGVPGSNLTGRSSLAQPRYGFRPTFVARPPAAG
ncbi:PPE family protein [Mycobacterium haemophilum]|uniref:PPE family protein n=1 Tax=Mycobacterium haemophilum TaxID=29311 RepID=A0A0I9UFI4_9MYCO|nr:PPE family protein [Mycobacterium haemophilum]KLO27990.1 hypothetical protein ABH39_15210 [Mycobacterium haemophilum]KLO35351.1 hypothetical protein ABH38_15805 [Mycobacterium haemophilum]KLO40538.1 hypothetical protein ABH37_15535 [Mycobacterium haemophilum]KLO47957.1 hypothetical protein ABH36_15350 [Mycobacterium haemophilum]